MARRLQRGGACPGTRTITIRRGLSGLFILEAAVIAAVTVVFMASLYRAYSGAVYDESAEVLNLYAVVADSKLSEIEALSFEILSNRDIQANLTAYADDPKLRSLSWREANFTPSSLPDGS